MEAYNRGLVFAVLKGTYNTFDLCRRLGVSFSEYLSWIRGGEISEEHLTHALALFGEDRETYDFLCSPKAVVQPF